MENHGCLYYSTFNLGVKIQGKNPILEFCALNQGVKRGGMCVTGFNHVTHMPPLLTPCLYYSSSNLGVKIQGKNPILDLWALYIYI